MLVQDLTARQGARLLLVVATGFTAVMTALLLLLAALVDRQGDLLADRSEAHGGFAPTVLPPFDDAIWLLGNAVAGLALVALVCLVALLVTTRRSAR